MQHAAEMRRCLAELDVAGARRLWAHVSPNMPQPRTDAEALAILHVARTASESLAARLRFYSHRWLLDHGYASQLPDHLKPSAERMYPRTVEAVGIALGGKSPIARAIKPVVMGAMQDAVRDCYANGDTAPEIVKPRILEAKADMTKKLIGRLTTAGV